MQASPGYREIVENLRTNRASLPDPHDAEYFNRMRELWDRMARPIPKDIRVKRGETIAGVQCSVFQAGDRSGGTFVFVHGGGYTRGNGLSHGRLAALLALHTRCSVVLPDYRLAPEHRYPAALQDVLAVVEELMRLDTPLFLAGDSAGGGCVLAAAQCLSARDRRADGIITYSAWTDLTLSGQSHQKNASSDGVLSETVLRHAVAAYVPKGSEREPGASPLFGSKSALPPMLLHVCAEEILADDTLEFARTVDAAGGIARLCVWPEMVHAWHSFADVLPDGRRALQTTGQFVREIAAGYAVRS